jgi:hypothetical protein
MILQNRNLLINSSKTTLICNNLSVVEAAGEEVVVEAMAETATGEAWPKTGFKWLKPTSKVLRVKMINQINPSNLLVTMKNGALKRHDQNGLIRELSSYLNPKILLKLR